MPNMDNAMKLHESCKYKGISLIFSLRGPTFAAYPIQAMIYYELYWREENAIHIISDKLLIFHKIF